MSAPVNGAPAPADLLLRLIAPAGRPAAEHRDPRHSLVVRPPGGGWQFRKFDSR